MLRTAGTLSQRPMRHRSLSILDRIYEHISLPPVVVAAIDTPQVQRLRELKQLGIVDFLYPGATHTRFEHSIGVAHLGRVWMNAIRSRQPELGVSDHDVELVMLAGLCHDLGHGPLCHLFEDVIVRRLGGTIAFRHEDMSVRLTELALADVGLSASDIAVVAGLINGQWAGEDAASPKQFMRELVANKRTGIDVDKIDYFLRDSSSVFGKSVSDVRPNRLFMSCRVAPFHSEWVVAFEDKMAGTLRDLCAIRAKLHRAVYQHQVTKRVGHMISDVLVAAAPHLKVHGHSLAECVSDPHLFLHLGDWILESILHSSDPQLQPARAIMERLRRRQLYKTACLRAFKPGAAMPEEAIELGLRDELRTICGGSATAADAVFASITIETYTLHHGMKGRDPLSAIPFYNPKDPQERIRMMPESEAGDIATPRFFEDKMVIVMSRSDDHLGLIRQACDRWSVANRGSLSPPSLFAYNDPLAVGAGEDGGEA